MRGTFCIAMVLVATLSAGAQVPVTGVQGATLNDLTGSPTLVTVVLKDRAAEDPNLRVDSVGPDFIGFVNPDTGERTAYAMSDIKELRVQGDKVEAKQFQRKEKPELTPDQQQLVKAAVRRSSVLFQDGDKDQELKMDMAMMLAASGDQNAMTYLTQLAEQDDIPTALAAAKRLYVAGKQDIGDELIEKALVSGNRQIRAQAAQVAGLYRAPIAEAYLDRMAHDRSADVAVPAVRALARMGNRQAIPLMLEMLSELNREKAEAATYALGLLGGDEVISQLRAKLDGSEGLQRFRIIKILAQLGDEQGSGLLKSESLAIPTLSFDAAVVLARQGDLEAMQILRERLESRYDTDLKIIELRAQAAAALIQGGDLTMVAELQDLLRQDFVDIKEPNRANLVKGVADVVARAATYAGVKRVMPVLQPTMQNAYPEVCASAATAIIGLGDPDVQNRLLELWDMR